MEALLPEGDDAAAIVNAAAMELGAVVCIARTPRCPVCPLLDVCAWVREGRPATPDLRRRQAKYEGSDRQARGAVLRALRASGSLPQQTVIADWPDRLQRDRAILSLLDDGLIEAEDGALHLPR